jgi:hypothetical protein
LPPLAAAFWLPSVMPRPGIADDHRPAVSRDDGRRVRNYAAVDNRDQCVRISARAKPSGWHFGSLIAATSGSTSSGSAAAILVIAAGDGGYRSSSPHRGRSRPRLVAAENTAGSVIPPATRASPVLFALGDLVPKEGGCEGRAAVIAGRANRGFETIGHG